MAASLSGLSASVFDLSVSLSPLSGAVQVPISPIWGRFPISWLRTGLGALQRNRHFPTFSQYRVSRRDLDAPPEVPQISQKQHFLPHLNGKARQTTPFEVGIPPGGKATFRKHPPNKGDTEISEDPKISTVRRQGQHTYLHERHAYTSRAARGHITQRPTAQNEPNCHARSEPPPYATGAGQVAWKEHGDGRGSRPLNIV